MKVFVVIVTEDGCDPRIGLVCNSEEKANAYGRQQEKDWGAEWYVEEWMVEE
jgi:hypothetical protein